MKEKTARELANERYRQNHKDYYNEYYREYYKKHPKKNYAKIYKERLDKLKETLYCWGEILDPQFQSKMLDIIDGKWVEEYENDN